MPEDRAHTGKDWAWSVTDIVLPSTTRASSGKIQVPTSSCWKQHDNLTLQIRVSIHFNQGTQEVSNQVRKYKNWSFICIIEWMKGLMNNTKILTSIKPLSHWHMSTLQHFAIRICWLRTSYCICCTSACIHCMHYFLASSLLKIMYMHTIQMSQNAIQIISIKRINSSTNV